MDKLGDWKQIKFGTDGWRGIIAADFTFVNVCRVTRAIARYLSSVYTQDRPIFVAYDTRFLASEFADTAAQVLAELGWTVNITLRDCPTPVIAYHAWSVESAGALMFTASHNPSAYCGIKYIPDYGGPATSEITSAIESYLSEVTDILPQSDFQDSITSFDPQPDYIRFILSQIDVEILRKAGFQVIYDALYSTSRGYLDQLLIACGCKVQSLHCYRDVLFGGNMPEPTQTQLGTLIQMIADSGADLGVATDGDSDRYGVVDEQGNLVEPNAILLVLTKHLVENKGKNGAIVRTVATTHLLDNLATQYNLKVIETAVGFKYIGAQMRKEKVLIGGEESGGLSIGSHLPEKDGIFASMLILEAMAASGQSLSELVKDAIAQAQGPSYNYRLDYHLNQLQIDNFVKSFLEQEITDIAQIPITKISTIDGIKLYLEDGSWILIRASGTEPLLRIYLETKSPEQQPAIVDYIQERMNNC